MDDSLRRILVVDDESTIRLALSRFLRTRGYEVEMAESGTVALSILAQQRFSLMLCDLRMPGVSGLEVVPQALTHDPHLGIIMLTAVNDAQSATDALSNGAFDYLTKPVELPDLLAAVERASMRRMRTMERHAIDRLIREEVALRTFQLEQEKEALRALTVSIAETLINAMEAKDLYLRGHSQRVADLGAAIATELGLPADTVDKIHLAGRLHDVGKIGIREEVLNKPGRLSDDEFSHVKDHVLIGLEILSPLNHLGDVLYFIRDHHERWNGAGYPHGRSGLDITIGGRILTAADAFDALTSKRAYRDPMSAQETLAYLTTQVGSMLEPGVCEALCAVVERGEVPTIPRVDPRP
ncbi:two-component response regulator [Gemmatimonas aurantiaca T-27]|uniref:Two-component response regulator n=1 Tax=Gemmatimonas aurantiaca (strain DSM 14586 / JCM 11422 / NBRC 100505 / T-27) TaxID=379066 RepID=C1A4T1_GEMAT|nr:two-component response regulator [Gemmatimonas aurantiaca T-27]